MFDFYEHIADLSAEERTTLAERLNPLSFAQQRLWFLDQLQPGNPAFNICTSRNITGSININVLEQALREVVRRHDILHTIVVVLEGKPYQVVSPLPPRVLALVDLGDIAEAERPEQVNQLARREARVSFDLAHGPLFRAILLRLDRENFTLLLTMHHIICDDWSIGILIREITALYKAFSVGNPSPLSELPIQYADFASWQREWLQGETLESQLLYWKQQLADYSPILEFPTDNPRPAVQTYRGDGQYIKLPVSLSQSLKAFSHGAGVTSFMTLLAAFKTLLHRYTGQEDIGVGSPIANRNRLEIEGLIGFFANTLVFRTQLHPDMRFQELLHRVQQVALEAYAHQDLPFEKLVEEISPERNLGLSPLFQVMLVMQNAPREELKSAGLKIRSRRIERGTTQFDFTLTAREMTKTISLDLIYNADLFDSARMTRMLGHYQVLLAGIVANPGQQLSKLPLLTDLEREHLLIQLNRTGVEYPLNQNIHCWFEYQVQRTPDRIAAVFQKEQITYGQLDQKANEVALLLNSHGLKKGSFIPVLMESCIEIVFSFLGIMKIAAAFVPLDPTWSLERQKEVLNELNSSLVIAANRKVYREELSVFPFLFVDGKPAGQPLTGLSVDIHYNSAMYALYTSGSTGKPKAVVVPHRGIINRFLWMNECFGSEAARVVLQTTRHVYDSALWQLLWPLIHGGKTVILPPHMEFSAENLAALINKYQVTLTDLVPSVFDMIAPRFSIGGEGQYPLDSLKWIIIGGEEITPATTFSFRQQFPWVRVINLYGPTETTIGCIFYEVKEKQGSKIPIGKPIANVKTLILDKQLNLVPLGVVGELYITGLCLGLGYLNNAEKTGAAFLENPYPELGYGRLYKTGDLARYLAGSNIEFLGRIDQQVKIQGLRIELEEIEKELTQHSSIQKAVVVVRQDPASNKRIIAYIMPHKGKIPGKEMLRSFLKHQLPQYMIPSFFIFLDSLPVTPGGKIHRKALPMPNWAKPELQETYVPPHSLTEEILVEIFASILGIEQAGIEDNFFTLGGNSLLAAQLVSRVREAFQIELPLQYLFLAPSVSQLAEKIETIRLWDQHIQVPAIIATTREDVLYASFAQEQMYVVEQVIPNISFFKMHFTLRIGGALNVWAMEQGINEIIKRHEILRTTFETLSGRPIQIIAPTMSLVLNRVDLRNLPDAVRDPEAKRIIKQEAKQPFELGKGPLLRIRLLQTGDEDYVLVFIIHHIICDGWSIEILVNELERLYESYTKGTPVSLPPLDIQYADFASWQRRILQSPVLEAQLSYWDQQLRGQLVPLQLPTDRPQPIFQSFRTSKQTIVFSADLYEAVKALSRKESCTLFMTLLSAFKILLFHYSGQEDIRVGTLNANRNRKEIEGIIGLFVNTLILRTRLSEKLKFMDLLIQIRKTTLDAYANQDIPFEELVEFLERERHIDRTGLFQVLFIFNYAPRRPLGLSNLTLNSMKVDKRSVEPEFTATTFDLIFTIRETPRTMVGSLTYKTDLFAAQTIKRMLNSFQQLLKAIISHPGHSISELCQAIKHPFKSS
ncbi:MAG: amino acid adenylation domain-containing protein [Candidatus Aminicenantes bacterium]|jgi:amino acid adenylation domain-containing protein